MSAARDSTKRWKPGAEEIDVSCKVAFLGLPQNYAERPTRVEKIETHFSWIFLTDWYVYKLKKPLRGDGFDFSTAQARRRNAEAEMRLNRRLAPGIYLGVVPLTLAGGCGLAIGSKGVVVDWLVKMVRLPAERMLDRRLARGDWHYADAHALADFLAKFFATARRVPIRRLPISTASAPNAARAAVLFIPAAVPRCSMPSTALYAILRPLLAAIMTFYCNASRIAGSWRGMAISVLSISVWDPHHESSIA